MDQLATSLLSAIHKPERTGTFAATPEVILGPFYPADRIASTSSDLTNLRGKTARGQHVQLAGRLLNKALRPVSSARIEIWQANCAGRYRHPGDQSRGQLDPAFDGFATQTTGAEGTYKFRTVMPGYYHTPLGDIRAPHIHFQVTAGSFRLVTQMFFPREPLNERDRFLLASQRRDMLVALYAQDSVTLSILSFSWDITLNF